jgi:LysR family transcriptional regulator for bpeEF and oprC
MDTLRGITVFVRVAEAKSFAAAARALLVDPTAISRTINALEEDLGVSLFVRSTRSVKLTEEGANFYRDCVRVLEDLDRARSQVRAAGATPQGRLKIGMAPGLTRRLFVRALPAFQRRYPDLEIILQSVSDLGEVTAQGIDVLVRPASRRQHGGHHGEQQSVVVRRLAQSRFVVCASPEYLERAGVPRVPADLARHACVVYVTLERDVLDEWQFARAGARQSIKVDTRLLIHGTDAYREAGIAGCGLIRLLACHVEDEFAARDLVPVLCDWECVGGPPLVAIYRKTSPTPPRITAFVRYLAEAFKRYDVSSGAPSGQL